MSEANYNLLRVVVYVVGVPIIVLLLARIVQRVRAIRVLDARLKAEEAARPTDPYAVMAAMAMKSKEADMPSEPLTGGRRDSGDGR